ncbi:MAG: hypothetical protein MH252_06670 [Thermosynechococcaceae cyanobacterium MS004]|nr:hypothetical protein [Thermosynechococcaceae cyanobacterium MS004]
MVRGAAAVLPWCSLALSHRGDGGGRRAIAQVGGLSSAIEWARVGNEGGQSHKLAIGSGYTGALRSLGGGIAAARRVV